MNKQLVSRAELIFREDLVRRIVNGKAEDKSKVEVLKDLFPIVYLDEDFD